MGAAALPAMSLAGHGFQAFGSVAKGMGTKAADDFQAARLNRAAEYGKLAADQTYGQMTEKLNTTLGNIDAVRAAAHDDPTSPTGVAFRDRQEYLGERERGIKVGSILAQARDDEASAAYLRSAGKNALMMGYLGTGASLGKGIGASMADMFFGSGFTGGYGSVEGRSDPWAGIR
jgi:hypothetical protein